MASLVSDLLGSAAGKVIGTFLHSVGALALLGGWVLYVVWHRNLRQGSHHPKLVAAAVGMTYVAIVANLAGGFMRTYLPDHPKIQDIADSPWVRVMLLKHLFIFMGIGAAIYALERVVPRSLDAFRQGRLANLSVLGHQAATTLLGLSIVVAAVLGAVAGETPLTEADGAGGAGGMDGGGMPGHGHDEPPDGSGDVEYHNATGQLTSSPAAPRRSTGTFDVPEGAHGIQLTLLWTPQQFGLGIEVKDPDGTSVLTTGMEADGSEEAALPGTAPAAGRWTYEVFSDLAINVEWTVSIRMPYTPSDETLFARTVTVAPGQIFEVNTQMPLGGRLNWDWAATAQVYFDVHSHFDDQVQTHVQVDAAEHEGSFTNGRQGGYSLLWENEASLPVQVDLRVWGDFEVDSVFPA